MMAQKIQRRKNVKENVYLFTLLLTAAVFPFSEALVSICAGLLLFQAIALQLPGSHSSRKLPWWEIFFPVSVFIVYLAGVVFTLDLPFALYELKKVIFWVVIPLGIFLSPRLSGKKIYFVLFLFVASVTVASLIISGRIFFYGNSLSADFRSVGFVSHIRFSFQVIMSLIILAWLLISRQYRKWFDKPFPVIILFFWLTAFLFLLKSLLGIIAFIGTIAIALLIFLYNTKEKRGKFILGLTLLALILVPAFYTGRVLYGFYDFKEVDPVTIDSHTLSGNPYHHDFNDKTRENGHLVYIYLCDQELKQEWNKRSQLKYNQMLNGFPLSNVLIRYLTSLGYKKDSAGVSKLSNEDIALIEKGVTNYKFGNRLFSIYPRIYETTWEVDYYLRTGDPNNKTLAQRVEFIKASFVLIKENPLFGIGTGNWVIKYDEVYDKTQTRLSDEKRGPSHNQYLSYLVKFGVAGFAWILFAILFPVFHLGHRTNFMFILFLVAFAFANVGDANLETHMGLSFFTFFYSLFLWNSTGDIKKPITA